VARVTSAQPVSPHNEALYEAGKKLLLDSVERVRDFTKLMISTNLSAIPIYLSLLKLANPKDYRPEFSIGVLMLLPAFTFLAGVVVGVVGYLPRVGTFSLDVPSEIEKQRTGSIARGVLYGFVCLGLFASATVLGAVVIVFALDILPQNDGT